jgi:NADPH-dependent curcumin reductase CurA
VTSVDRTSTQIHLANRPVGWPSQQDFRTVRTELPELQPGEVRVRNEWLSVDPYMRGRMNDGRSYLPPFQVDAVMTGGALGRVVASRADGVEEGDLVSHQLGWRDVAQGRARSFQRVPAVPGVPDSAHLGVLGVTGFTAWLGLTEIAAMQEGDVVLVSGAAGSVGSAVGQLAKLKGASRTIGSAGGPEKARLLTERYGFDVAIDYKAGPIRRQLIAATGREDGEGIDVYFDNVGGDHLQAAIEVCNDGARIALCGAIAAYNDERRTPGPDNLWLAITRGLTLRGFTIPSMFGFFPAFVEEVAPWVAEGRIAFDETVRDGLDSAVDAFLDLMRGANTGKMLVRLS